MTIRPLDEALRALGAVTNVDDLRWLSAWIGLTRLEQRPEIRGIDFYGYEPGEPLRAVLDAAAALVADDLITLRIVVDLLHAAYRPIAGEARGDIQIKTVRRDYLEIDFETGEPVHDEDGKPIYYTAYYPYVYVRIYAGKGDADRRRAKLLSLYADRGSGKQKEGGGFGGYVAKALGDGLIDKDAILDAWHAGQVAYGAFVDGVEQLVKDKLQADKTIPNHTQGHEEGDIS